MRHIPLITLVALLLLIGWGAATGNVVLRNFGDVSVICGRVPVSAPTPAEGRRVGFALPNDQIRSTKPPVLAAPPYPC